MGIRMSAAMAAFPVQLMWDTTAKIPPGFPHDLPAVMVGAVPGPGVAITLPISAEGFEVEVTPTPPIIHTEGQSTDSRSTVLVGIYSIFVKLSEGK